MGVSGVTADINCACAESCEFADRKLSGCEELDNLGWSRER